MIDRITCDARILVRGAWGAVCVLGISHKQQSACTLTQDVQTMAKQGLAICGIEARQSTSRNSLFRIIGLFAHVTLLFSCKLLWAAKVV